MVPMRRNQIILNFFSINYDKGSIKNVIIFHSIRY